MTKRGRLLPPSALPDNCILKQKFLANNQLNKHPSESWKYFFKRYLRTQPSIEVCPPTDVGLSFPRTLLHLHTLHSAVGSLSWLCAVPVELVSAHFYLRNNTRSCITIFRILVRQRRPARNHGPAGKRAHESPIVSAHNTERLRREADLRRDPSTRSAQSIRYLIR